MKKAQIVIKPNRPTKGYFAKYLTEEDHIHGSIIKYVTHAYPGMLIMHAPMEGKRSAFERYKATVLGLSLSKGYPDLYLVYKGVDLHLELKTVTGKLLKEQELWISALKANGKDVQVAYGTDEAIKIIDYKFKHLKQVKYP